MNQWIPNMNAITIELTDDRMKQLNRLAEAAQVAPDQLVLARVEEWLSAPPDDFVKAARYVLTKNAELYKRLA